LINTIAQLPLRLIAFPPVDRHHLNAFRETGL
jgi:hypothetical protein